MPPIFSKTFIIKQNLEKERSININNFECTIKYVCLSDKIAAVYWGDDDLYGRNVGDLR